MYSLTRKRSIAGNICLVVFFAFLALVFYGTAGPIGNAQAVVAPVPVQSDDQGLPTDQQIQIQATSTSSVQLKFYIHPVTAENFENTWFDFSQLGVPGEVYLSQMVYESVYSTALGEVYSVVYDLAPGVDFPWDVAKAVYVYNQPDVEPSDWINVIFKPPTSGGGGGGGGGSTTPSTTNTDTGTAVTNPTTGQTVVGVDPAKVEQQLESQPAAKELVIEIPPVVAAQTKESKVDIPAAVLDTVQDAGKDLVFKTPEASITMPPNALLVPEVKQAEQSGAQVSVSLSVKEASVDVKQGLDQTLSQPDNKGYSAVGPVLELNFTMTVNNGEPQTLNRFNGSIQVAVPYNPADLQGKDQNKLGVYLLTPEGLKFVKCHVDPVNHVVVFRTEHFSEYVLMVFDKTFADIAAHWAKADIELMAAKHIANGVSATEFMPDRTITRAEFAALLQRVLDLPAPADSATFTDVASGDWYFASVEAAYQAGLVKGYGDGTFKPAAPISRQEMATFVTRAMKIAGKNTTISDTETDSILAKFKDAASIQAWAREASAVAVQQGIVSGRAVDEYAPVSNATRAEGMVMIKRMMSSTDLL